jgi:ATP-dependent protease ClpP protease subunit
MMEITISGPLFPWTENDSRLIQEKLDTADPMEELNVYVHSPGGSIWEGKALYSMFLRHKGIVNMFGEGLVGSAASFMVLAGNTFTVQSITEYFVHSAMMDVFFFGNAKDLEKLITDLGKKLLELRAEDEALAQLYADRTGIAVPKMTAFMEEETTWRGKDIVTAKFATAYQETPARETTNLAKFDLSNLKAGPASQWHQKVAVGQDCYRSWLSSMGMSADKELGANPTPASTQKIREVAIARAGARDRMLALKRPK